MPTRPKTRCLAATVQGAAGAGDLVDCGDGPGAEGEGADRLGAADGVDFVEPQHGRGGENHRVRQAAGAGRVDYADLLDAGNLRRHRGHQQRRQQRGLPSGDAEADPAQRQDRLPRTTPSPSSRNQESRSWRR